MLQQSRPFSCETALDESGGYIRETTRSWGPHPQQRFDISELRDMQMDCMVHGDERLSNQTDMKGRPAYDKKWWSEVHCSRRARGSSLLPHLAIYRSQCSPRRQDTRIDMDAVALNTIFRAYDDRLAELDASASTNPYARGIAWIAGEYVPLHEARVPLVDQGFLHGYQTYDAPAVWDGQFFRLDDHIARLEASCARLRLRLPISREELKRLLAEMVAKSGLRDALAEMIVTKGIVDTRQLASDTVINNLYMFAKPYSWVMRHGMQQTTGGSAIVARTVRRVPPGAIDPTAKSLQWGDLVRAMFEAQDRGATYAMLTDGDGNLTEGPAFNILLVNDGVIYTPDRGCLKGITRECVFEIAK